MSISIEEFLTILHNESEEASKPIMGHDSHTCTYLFTREEFDQLVKDLTYGK